MACALQGIGDLESVTDEEEEENLVQARLRMHELLDEAFSLVAPRRSRLVHLGLV